MAIDYTPEGMQRVAEDVMGTCGSLDEALRSEFGDEASFDDVPIEMLELLDDIVLACESCGWWCEASEMDGDCFCKECQEGGDDE